MSFFVYVIRNPDGRLYIGFTTDLKRRVAQHQVGEGGWTRSHGPWELVHFESYGSRAEALRRERYLKGGRGREFLKDVLNGRAGPPQAD